MFLQEPIISSGKNPQVHVYRKAYFSLAFCFDEQLHTHFNLSVITLVPSVFVPLDQRSGATWKDPIGSPKMPDFRLNCACVAAKPNMASSLTEEAVNYALKAVGKQNITLKEKQLSILKLIVLEKKDVLAVLPTGFGKSLIYQTIAPFADFIERDESTERGKSIVIVISPLNALIKEQVTKLRETGLRACILKADRVASDCQDIEEVSISSSEELENLANFQLLYAHQTSIFHHWPDLTGEMRS